MVVQPNDISGHRTTRRFAPRRHESDRILQLHIPTCADMPNLEALVKAARGDAKKSNPVVVGRIHIGLNLEHKSSKR